MSSVRQGIDRSLMRSPSSSVVVSAAMLVRMRVPWPTKVGSRREILRTPSAPVDMVCTMSPFARRRATMLRAFSGPFVSDGFGVLSIVWVSA